MTLDQIIAAYRADAPLAYASTIPASWYTDPRVLELELTSAFASSWQMAGRADEVRGEGDFIACELPGGEPVIVVRGNDGALRALFNVCRHHAAAVVSEPHGTVQQFRCPYHGWTYALDGTLKGTPDFTGVCDFDRSAHGLTSLRCGVCEPWVFVSERGEVPMATYLGTTLTEQLRSLGIDDLHWMERRHYLLDCNWKVFVDNYLDGGYHVPHLHKSLDSVLSNSEYTIEIGERFCLQSSPMVTEGADERTGAVRKGERAYYYWLYPNFMINC